MDVNSGAIWYTFDMQVAIPTQEAMHQFGVLLGQAVHGGDVVELVGDVGAGKTTLTKSLAAGMGITDDVQSPTFTLSRIYESGDTRRLAHYDFYRLQDAGILSAELRESVEDPSVVTVVEWADIVQGALPRDRLTITIRPTSEESRQLQIESGGPLSQRLLEEIER